jgi:hypothetical protein
MMKPLRIRFDLIVLTACLALAAVFAELFIFASLNHDCCQDHCEICLQIQAVQSLLEGLGRIATTAFCAGLAAVYAGVSGKIPAQTNRSPLTPVALKVKFSF